jgi:hypothetical protein
MRSTRETELAEEFPMHVVCKWMGNSQPVAAKHYLQVTDEHFQRAAGMGEAARKAAQSAAVLRRKGPKPAATTERRGAKESDASTKGETPYGRMRNLTIKQ